MKSSPSKAGKRTKSVSGDLLPVSAPVAGASEKPLNILVPVDFSRPSGHALQCAADFARLYGGRIALVTVIEPDPFHRFETHALAVSRKTLERRLRTELFEFGQKLAGKDQVHSVTVLHGKPFGEIVKAARAFKTDLIVMATHGHTGLKHVLLGSTAERVIRYAPCAVLTVRGDGNQGWPIGKR